MMYPPAMPYLFYHQRIKLMINKMIIVGTAAHSLWAFLLVLAGLTPVGAGLIFLVREVAQLNHKFPGTKLDFTGFSMFWQSFKRMLSTYGLRIKEVVKPYILIQWAVPFVVALVTYKLHG